MTRRFARISICGHAHDGEGDAISLEQAYTARSITYSWDPCYSCLRGGAPLTPGGVKYGGKRHPYAPAEVPA